MEVTAKAKAPKVGGSPFYVCPECDGVLQCATLEGERRVRLHQILHVPDGKVRWQMQIEWRSEQAQTFGSVPVE
jgi:hypothetical protein